MALLKVNYFCLEVCSGLMNVNNYVGCEILGYQYQNVYMYIFMTATQFSSAWGLSNILSLLPSRANLLIS